MQDLSLFYLSKVENFEASNSLAMGLKLVNTPRSIRAMSPLPATSKLRLIETNPPRYRQG